MQIKPLTDKHKREFNKVAAHPLQSWEWGEFRKATGNKVVRLAVFEGKKITKSIQVVFSKIPFTSFKIGTDIRSAELTLEELRAIKDLAKKENAIFIKLEPFFTETTKNKSSFNKALKALTASGCVEGKTLFTPTSFWINLTKSEDDLVKGFHPKTRYNIKYATRKGVKVVEDNSDKAFEKYLKLTRETVERQGFYAHSEKYHRLMWKHLHTLPVSKRKKPIARLLTSKYKGEILTTWIVFVWHYFLYYPYGASTDKYKNVQANSLMMWEAIRYGKAHNLKTFDLWGREEGKGFTKFKEGFSPKVVKFIGTWDLVASPLYYPYKITEKVRWSLLRAQTKTGLVKPKF